MRGEMATGVKPRSDHEWIAGVVRNNDSPRIAYGTIISTLGFVASVVYGIWALNQAQLASIERQISSEHTQFSQQFQQNREELARRESEVKSQIANIETDLSRRRQEFVGQDEFRQFRERVLNDVKIIRDRLVLIEQSKPSVGELQAITSALRDRIEKLYNLIEKQEDWIRPLHPPASPAR